jgi:hypothetical protein
MLSKLYLYSRIVIVPVSQVGDCNILICDETCDSLSPAILAAVLLVRYQV